MMRFDQHFLTNEKIAKQIVSFLEIGPNESVLEIGPGKGVLSKYLNKADLVELDKDLADELKNKFPNHKIINKNVLKLNLNYDKIIGNIPYSISEPLINKLINSKFRLCILTVSEKFLERGLLKLITPKFLEIKTLMKIDKKEFFPIPKVDSKVIQIRKKQLNNEEKLIKKIYICSDKKLKNIINTNLNFKEKKVRELNIDEWKVLLNDIKRA
jgi:16S rRNA A1518/A1519 N6-dimethyltransferase RsmA/KsgA/DIM1 with predicted DNA glycosylase/AP lyase activity